jgi:hypothetical protein
LPAAPFSTDKQRYTMKSNPPILVASTFPPAIPWEFFTSGIVGYARQNGDIMTTLTK